jgi:hypothetical protein
MSDPEDLPCRRTRDNDPDGTPAWNCDNDHTGCLWNDGNNTCMHDGESLQPLEDPLSTQEVDELKKVFPELSWMGSDDWNTVAGFADWSTWIRDFVWAERPTPPEPKLALRRMLGLRKNRVKIRKDCRSYYGKENVDNINDPEDPTWA